MTHRFLFRRVLAVLAALGLALGLPSEIYAGQKVIFSKIDDPADIESAVRYWRRELEPETYDNARDFAGTVWTVTKTLEEYIRKYIRIGRADINDDGIDELFYLHSDTRFCGSIGCPVVIFERRNGAWVEICGTSGSDRMEITDWLTEDEGPYREMEARYRIFWWKGSCELDSPENREYHPPPPNRVWKPLPRAN